MYSCLSNMEHLTNMFETFDCLLSALTVIVSLEKVLSELAHFGNTVYVLYPSCFTFFIEYKREVYKTD